LRASLMRAVNENRTDHLPLIRYDIERGGKIEQAYWSATHTPVLGEDGRTVYVLQHTTDVTELHRLREMASAAPDQHNRSVEAAIVQRAEAVQALNDQLGAEIERLRLLFEQAPGFMAVLWGPDHVFTMANAAYEQLVGGRDV